MEELKELKGRLTRERPNPWDGMPDIPLYMDQMISYMPRQLVRYGDGETLTPAMVNNYIKDGLLPRADGKKYNRTHLAFLTTICALKQVLSVKEIKTLLDAGTEMGDARRLYEDFSAALDCAMNETAANLDDGIGQEELAKLALRLALRSYADKLACQRVLDLLRPPEGTAEKDKKKNKDKDKAKEAKEHNE